MKIESLHIGMRVRHPQYGTGIVKALNELTAEIQFDGGEKRAVAPDAAGLEPAEPQTAVSGLNLPLKQFIEQTVDAAVVRLGLEKPDAVIEKLGLRWHGGRLGMHPADPALQAKEVSLEIFFHKIVMVRNNLRVLEQKINAHEKLTDGEKVEMQQYITRSYGSVSTVNVLFKEKEDQFLFGFCRGAQASPRRICTVCTISDSQQNPGDTRPRPFCRCLKLCLSLRSNLRDLRSEAILLATTFEQQPSAKKRRQGQR